MPTKKTGTGARGRGAGRGSRGRAGTTKTEREQRQELYDKLMGPLPDVDSREDDYVWQVLVRGQLDKVPMEHLIELRGVTSEPPSSYEMEGTAFVSSTGGRAWGVYSPLNKTVHIHPSAARAGPSTTFHEVGHHWDYRRAGLGSWDKSSVYSQDHAWFRQQVGTQVLPRYKFMSRTNMAKMGMTQYAKTDTGEFMAEAYDCWMRGSVTQWSRLCRYVDARTDRDSTPRMAEVFGPRQDIARDLNPYFS